MKALQRLLFLSLFFILFTAVSGCVGTIVETATDAAVAVAKVPFKVGAAVVDVVSGDDEEEANDGD